MSILSELQISSLLSPYLGSFPIPPNLYTQLGTYLDLLLKWNARTNLTSIREPEEIVRRHFGESLFTGVHIASKLNDHASLLDFGSGAGFPGLPIQLLLPQLQVTLAESQNKKATFLREVVRTLSLPTTVHGGRVEDLPAAQVFTAVTLRAVDNMQAALSAATPRIAQNGWLAVLTSKAAPEGESYPLPHSAHAFLSLSQPLLR